MMRHVLIVGGTRGLGRATARLLASSGWAVSVVARAMPEETIPGCRYYAHDILSFSGFDAVLQSVCEAGGPLHGAAVFLRHRGDSAGAWAGNLASTLGATREVIHGVRPFLAKEGDRSFVLMGSTASRLVADEQDEGYHAAKAGILGLCRYYAFVFGQEGVRVNCVSPGTLLKEESKHFFLDHPERHDLFRQTIPLRRMGTAEELGNVVRFLLSPEASFLTGQDIVVDGGASLQSQESLARVLRPVSK